MEEKAIEIFMREQRRKLLARLAKDDIPQGVLPKVMDTWLEIENACADALTVKGQCNG